MCGDEIRARDFVGNRRAEVRGGLTKIGDRAVREAREKIARVCVIDARKRARKRRARSTFNGALCALGAFDAKKSLRMRAYQLRSDKDFVYFT